ncbi:hypothetical protein NQ315_011133 [Exocentrus adspersus]|uniref:O-acyltransferase n=1 Tax=Exocentrus adspersus TaxID=1586481 RepID=A0AAV8VYB3_9CUCU|nr:hypothetical protein NQ315_011133 [Exocentrus adspersus]
MSPNSNITPMDESNNYAKTSHSKIKIGYRPLPEKKFEARNSLLTDLFESNPHIKTILHVFIATLLSLFVNKVAHDYLEKGEIDLGFGLIHDGFGKLHVAICAWLLFFTTTCLCYLSFFIWARARMSLFPKSVNIKIWDTICLLPLPGYYVLSFRLAASIVAIFRLPQATAAIILVEQIRMAMKVHAFIRSNVPKVLNYKTHSEQHLTLPSFKHFLYFLFAPTLIYRDEYPRTSSVRKSFVMYRLLEILGVVLFYSFLLNRFLFPVYQDFGLRKFTWNEIIISIFESAIVGILILTSTFFLILHSVQNVFAELLRFGDRMFYKDWWTCTSFSEYFRTWNIVVHDWLYTYVYKDMYEIITAKNKTISRFAVFVISAVVHEWVLTHMFGFFFPALFIYFFFGGALLSFIKVSRGTVLNVLFWYMLAVGSGSLLSLYTLEHFARQNAPIQGNSFRDYCLPRWLTCDCIGK